MVFCQGILKRKARPRKGGGMPAPFTPLARWHHPGDAPLGTGAAWSQEREQRARPRFPQGNSLSCCALFRRGFRLCGGDQRAFRSPFGNLRPFAANRNLHKMYLPCGREGPSLPAPYRRGFRLCGGDQRAFRSPFGNLRPLAAKQIEICTRNSFLAEGKDIPSPQRKKARLSSRRAFLHGISMIF